MGSRHLHVIQYQRVLRNGERQGNTPRDQTADPQVKNIKKVNQGGDWKHQGWIPVFQPGGFYIVGVRSETPVQTVVPLPPKDAGNTYTQTCSQFRGTQQPSEGFQQNPQGSVILKQKWAPESPKCGSLKNRSPVQSADLLTR